MTRRYELTCVSIIIAILCLAGIAGFLLPPDSRTPELAPPSRCNAPELAQPLPTQPMLAQQSVR